MSQWPTLGRLRTAKFFQGRDSIAASLAEAHILTHASTTPSQASLVRNDGQYF
jgi:hypothetical protein